jgi:hypothetical protein
MEAIKGSFYKNGFYLPNFRLKLILKKSMTYSPPRMEYHLSQPNVGCFLPPLAGTLRAWEDLNNMGPCFLVGELNPLAILLHGCWKFLHLLF